ncbi:hypothetical protein GAQ39_002754, partial [Escherichia coli]|nr:hypothetical protein [Escherichia coli]
MSYKAGEVIMRKLLLPLLFMAGTVNAASSVKEICTDYTKYLGHVYGFAVSQDESMRKKLLSDMKRLKLSEAMVQQELYKVATNENAKYQYSRLLNPDANEINRSTFDYMVKACETAPDFAIPSWGVLVASNAVNKEDVGRNGIDSIRNAPGMRHQNVQGTLEERARGPGTNSPMGNLSPEELQEYNQRMEQYEKAAREKMEQQKNGSLNTFQQGLKALNL